MQGGAARCAQAARPVFAGSPSSRFVGAAKALCPNVYFALPIQHFAAACAYLPGSCDPAAAPGPIALSERCEGHDICRLLPYKVC